jgi:hypothetical protein
MERLTGRVGACVGVLSEAPREGRADHLIPSVGLRMRIGFRTDAMLLISPNCLLSFANTGCWCEPDSRFEQEMPSKRNSSVRWCEQ